MTARSRPSRVRPVPLGRLLDLLPDDRHVVGAIAADVGSLPITGLSLASQRVRPGDLYAALPGAQTHGARFSRQATEAGAVAVLTDPAGVDLSIGAGVPVVVVADPRRVVGALAAEIYAHPAERLTLVGITGTHGKTTTTQLVAAGAAATGRRTAVVGTMGTFVDGRPVASTLTTPEAPELHALLAVMVESGVECCAMEVSSHALVMGRVDAVVFDLAVFTNLGRDHLDFHRDVEDYFQAKARLFTRERCRRALVNVDDAAGRRLLADAEVPSVTFSPSGAPADWRVEAVELSADGSTFSVHGRGRPPQPAAVQLAGEFNVANALCALAAVGESGYDVAAAAGGVAAVSSVAGRMERIRTDLGFAVVVDYAHKPDAVRSALSALRPVTPGRLSIVIGAGGDRDAGKRPMMGAAAAELADLVVVTDDNPRSEDPASIRAQIIAGAADFQHSTEAQGWKVAAVREVADRYEAIRSVLRQAHPGDTVLIAGKGHEGGQEANGLVSPFDDREAARTILGEIAREGAGR